MNGSVRPTAEKVFHLGAGRVIVVIDIAASIILLSIVACCLGFVIFRRWFRRAADDQR